MTNYRWMIASALALAGALLTGCSDDGNGGPDSDAGIDAPMPEGTCRGFADCPPDESCAGPNDVACGIPPQEGCMSDGDCQLGEVCNVIPDSCSADGFGSECGQSCTPGDPCGDNLICAENSACRPIACDQPGIECRPSEICDPASIDPAGPVYDIDRGCENITCTDDGPCPGATVCVNGYCQDGLGMCSPPVP